VAALLLLLVVVGLEWVEAPSQNHRKIAGKVRIEQRHSYSTYQAG
jgi:hypothetical protein